MVESLMIGVESPMQHRLVPLAVERTAEPRRYLVDELPVDTLAVTDVDALITDDGYRLFKDWELEGLESYGIPVLLVRTLAKAEEPSVVRDQLATTSIRWDICANDRDSVARWLDDLSPVSRTVTAVERRQLEALARHVGVLIDEGELEDLPRDDVAQIYAALQTIQAQLRAPRPHRPVLGWALRQLDQIPAGFLAGLAANHLPLLIKAFT